MRFDLPGSAERTRAALDTARRIGNRYYESIAAAEPDAGLGRRGRVGRARAAGHGAARALRRPSGRRDPPLRARDRFRLSRRHRSGARAPRSNGRLERQPEQPAPLALRRLPRDDRRRRRRVRRCARPCRPSDRGDRPDRRAVESRRAASAFPPRSARLYPSDGSPMPTTCCRCWRSGPLATCRRTCARNCRAATGCSRRREARWPRPSRTSAPRSRGSVRSAFPYWLATAQTDLADLLVHDERVAEARSLLDQARTVFSRLGAAPALQRAECGPGRRRLLATWSRSLTRFGAGARMRSGRPEGQTGRE